MISLVGCTKGWSATSYIPINAKCHTLSGSHATALTALRPTLFKVRLSFFVLTSQTVTKPALLPVTRICATFLFQSKHSISSVRAALFPNRKGLSTLFRSEMKSSPLAPPVARRFECLGLNWRALMAPECFEALDMNASLRKVSKHSLDDRKWNSAPRSSNKLIGVPQIQRAVLQATCDHTTFCLIEISPGEVIESVKVPPLACHVPGSLKSASYPESVSILASG